MRRGLGLLSLISALSVPSPALAQDTLDVKGWLSRPGVKLVAVEFYANWCKPCMDAVPRWDALRKKYESAGLRLIVVATREQDATCANPGWTPDQTVCDVDGKIADTFHAHRLPSAFLWSWQGHLLVKSGHVDAVEAAIERYMRETPSVLVEVTQSPDSLAAESLRALVEEKVRDHDKIIVALTDVERDRMRKAQAAILSDPAYKQELGCSVGEEIPPNSLLQVSADANTLSLRLTSIEKGCLIESASAQWTGDREEVGRVVAELVGKLRKGVDLPEAQEPRSSVQSSVELAPLDLGDDGRAIKNPTREAKAFLFVDSDPKGARIIINGKEVGVAPYQDELVVGEYTIIGRHSTHLYKPGKQTITLEPKGQKVKITLAPNFGVLKVESDPPGAKIELGSEPTGEVTPFTFPRKPAGSYPVRLTLPLYDPATTVARLADGQVTPISLRLAPDFGVLRVTSNPPGAEISINGEPTGQVTPFRFPPRKSGTYEVSVAKPPLYLPSSEPVTLAGGKEAPVALTLSPNFGTLLVTSSPTGMDILLDREPTGKRTPARVEPVPAGMHEVEVRSAQYGAPSQRPTVRRGEEISADFTMTPRLGLVKVLAAIVDEGRSEPVAAEVLLDGKLLDETAPLSRELLVGEYDLAVRAEGAHPFSQRLQVEEGATQTIKAELEKMLPEEVLRLRELARLEAEAREAAEARASRRNWLLGGGIGAAVLGGVGVAVAATAGRSAADEAGTPEELDGAVARARTFEIGGASLLGVGAALVSWSLISLAGE